jgi:hypothetical protein
MKATFPVYFIWKENGFRREPLIYLEPDPALLMKVL